MELNKNKNPFITVIITVFNRSRKLKRAVESVLSQTYKNFEIIVVDDGSSDHPEKYIFRLIKENINIKYIKHSNRNSALSINAGLRLASGKFITFLDSDDRYKPEHLKLRIQLFSKFKQLDLIHTSAKILCTADEMLIPDARNTEKLISIDKCVIGATIFGKKNVFERLKGFRDIYGYDYDFLKRCSRIFRTMKVDMPTYVYYRNSKDSVLSKKKKMIMNKLNQSLKADGQV
ncbi:MAG: glycosyltransferase family 2 protein [Ignavibacteria bacterium]|nr:glycosyltransferase family 2 protein [Ignavibacteria bacterium]